MAMFCDCYLKQCKACYDLQVQNCCDYVSCSCFVILIFAASPDYLIILEYILNILYTYFVYIKLCNASGSSAAQVKPTCPDNEQVVLSEVSCIM